MAAIDFSAIPRSALPALLQAAPKAELHLHIEGSLEPELMFELAQRNHIQLSYPDVASLRQAYAFSNLQSFLDIYYAGASVLITAADFEAMCWAYCQRAAADGIVRAELFFDPQTHTERGIALATVLEGLLAGIKRAERELGLSLDLIPCFLRHLSEAEALQTLQALEPFREQIIGVGLDSSERGHPPLKFARAFAAARAMGLHVVAHAGEEGPAAYIWSALEDLGVERIDHGVRCLEDPDLVAHLRQQRIPLTVCPLSNVKLRVFDKLQEHCLPRLLDEGLMVMLNSDDPAYFGGYLGENLRQCFDALPQLGAEQAYRLLRNSLEASFATDADKHTWIARLDACFLAAAGQSSR
ncbi:adenosine deaminase [Paucibacter sp. APW11]|uniref:Adenine deaminase n=1 Tax=Roseateles aquae TaxID=3077235 RepID=A0ABU3P9E7_9BURK|nr:adenosine deaminase [Paucibacter sp. APW11]MDT8999205.1 adenosine deaminase [Paucibacter sp. APW11]